MRQAFIMRLKLGALAEYRRQHAAVWPELEAEIAAAGIERLSLFAADPIVLVTSEVCDAAAWERLQSTPVHRRWSKVMEPLMDIDADGRSDPTPMYEVYRFPPDA